jgi:phospholipase/carboxylesterase
MPNNKKLNAEILETNKNITYSVIWLHGLGADGHDFVPLIPELQLPDTVGIRFIFPHAPIRPVTINNGLAMRAWYDILSTSFENSEKEADILQAVAEIQVFIDAEIQAGIAPKNILLVGFSQGGVIALHTALRFSKRLAGVMLLSTYIPFVDKLLAEMQVVQKGLPIFSAHGRQDPILPFEKSQHYVHELEKKGFALQSFDYDMQHSVCAKEITDIRAWLLQQFDKK